MVLARVFNAAFGVVAKRSVAGILPWFASFELREIPPKSEPVSAKRSGGSSPVWGRRDKKLYDKKSDQ